MKRSKKQSSILSGRMVVLAFLFVTMVGAFGLVTVGLRQQIASTATEVVEMERRLVELSRFEARYTGEIAIALSPGRLEAQNRRLELGLRQPTERQVIRVDGDTQIQFAQRRWNQVASVPEGQRFNFELADRN